MKNRRRMNKEKVRVYLTKFQDMILNSVGGRINKTHLFLEALSNLSQTFQGISREEIEVFSENKRLSGKTLTFLVPREIFGEMIMLAKKHKCSLSAIARYALAVYFKDLSKELCFENGEGFIDYLPEEIEA